MPRKRFWGLDTQQNASVNFPSAQLIWTPGCGARGGVLDHNSLEIRGPIVNNIRSKRPDSIESLHCCNGLDTIDQSEAKPIEGI